MDRIVCRRMTVCRESKEKEKNSLNVTEMSFSPSILEKRLGSAALAGTGWRRKERYGDFKDGTFV